MSRSGYSDDCENLNLWRANVDRTIAGKRGQAFLRELIDSLEAMPQKRLITEELRAEGGEVCAIGAVGVKRGVDMKTIDPTNPEEVAPAFGISTMLAQEIVYQNDERGTRQTPEDVRAHVLRDHEASHRAANAVDDAWERNSYVSPR